jgi:putative SOS response-associated peptidase YedK
MCGRYRLSRRKQMIEEYFGSVSGEDDWNPRYNIAPTQPVPVIRQNPKEPRRELSLLRWGLIPSWAKDPSVAVQMIVRKFAKDFDTTQWTVARLLTLATTEPDRIAGQRFRRLENTPLCG